MNIIDDIRIVRLAPGDAKCDSDHLSNFSSLVLSCEGMYPGIEKWIKNKVIPGIKTEERGAFVGYLGDVPVVSAVTKKGADSKICHLKIAPSLQNTNLGEVFMTLMGVEMKPHAERVHFTIPDSLWQQKHTFFESFGFQGTEIADVQYRDLIDPELRSKAKFASMWQAIIDKMPKLADLYSVGGFHLDGHLLFSIQPKYSQAILTGTKTVEIRRRFTHRWDKSRVNLYESAPTMGLVGEALIVGIDEDRVESIWSRYGDKIGATYEEYLGYVGDCSKVYAVILDDVRAYKAPIPLIQLEMNLGEVLHPPQSYLTLENNKPWARAISLAAYLHGCLPGRSMLRDGVVQRIPRKERAPFVSYTEQMFLKI
ncbi:MAG: hypothetical protein JNM99_14860 [Verrucomicrobiaceae bacterium]|nr:hypothetical protein [Verrucomicrobiaceae bacterium]